MMRLYRTKPAVISAFRWDGDTEKARKFIPTNLWSADHYTRALKIANNNGGWDLASVGDYIIQGVNGEFYPVKPDIFAKKYELAEVHT